ncbi:hypothetical protein [Acinetobacter sp. WCHAc060025]|uniref:hypothetical protein n=1 Tax=Acinetobacter sp. WCHAc060025 TaxID=2518625 RepID=UPI0013EE82F3|nr:hypothetical protein [Acinetobacter sp. WCHAc060025]
MKIDHELKSEKALKDTNHLDLKQPQSQKNFLNRSDFNKPFPKGAQISNGRILP